ncbi:MAG: GNAT family N-acetyltransferase [Oscillospiraceae bacterium]|nr:GNAT family N-acetyltransferase [Oscillospiraceae bacterium]
MTEQEIIRYVNSGANFYLRLFGDAEHMEYHKNDFYSFIQPKHGEHGVRFAFDVKLENLSEKEQLEKISKLKLLKMPVWWDLQVSDNLYRLINGKSKAKPISEPVDGDELYMAIFPNERMNPTRMPANVVVKMADTPAAFEEWATAVNTIMFDGYADIHPVNHYHLCEKGLINCFTCYYDGIAVAFASVMDDAKICSLEFVATDPNYRRQGFATVVCSEAMSHAFSNGAQIITLRALQPGTKELYTSLGFKIYNYAL